MARLRVESKAPGKTKRVNDANLFNCYTNFPVSALLVFAQQSYCPGAGVRRSVYPTHFLGNRHTDSLQILHKTVYDLTYPPPPEFFLSFFIFLFIYFLNFTNFLRFRITGPYGEHDFETRLPSQFSFHFSQTDGEIKVINLFGYLPNI